MVLITHGFEHTWFCLADVGMQLVSSGNVMGGALWADMREVGSVGEVEARLCLAVGIKKVCVCVCVCACVCAHVWPARCAYVCMHPACKNICSRAKCGRVVG
jgi:hypothetical protein